MMVHATAEMTGKTRILFAISMFAAFAIWCKLLQQEKRKEKKKEKGSNRHEYVPWKGSLTKNSKIATLEHPAGTICLASRLKQMPSSASYNSDQASSSSNESGYMSAEVSTASMPLHPSP